jgi:hypothetical protein
MDAFECKQAALEANTGIPVTADPVRGNDPVTRDDERESILSAERSGRPRGPGAPCERCQLTVGDDFAPRNGAGHDYEVPLQRRCPCEVDRDALIRRRDSAEVCNHPTTQIGHTIGTDA